MLCNYCGNALSDRWRYCPYCGKKIEEEPDILDSLFRDGVTGFSIRITSVGGDRRVTTDRYGVRVPITAPDEEQTEKPRAIPQKVMEPEGRAQRVGNHMLIRVKLPGVKEEDVDVRKLEESVEIKAYKNNDAYFKQFEVPHGARIISRRMDGDELIVEIG